MDTNTRKHGHHKINVHNGYTRMSCPTVAQLDKQFKTYIKSVNLMPQVYRIMINFTFVFFLFIITLESLIKRFLNMVKMVIPVQVFRNLANALFPKGTEYYLKYLQNVLSLFKLNLCLKYQN